MKKKDEMSLYDKVCDYTVVKEEIVDNKRVVTLRTHSGYTAICRIPLYTEEERQRARENVCEALLRFQYPGMDLSDIKVTEIKA